MRCTFKSIKPKGEIAHTCDDLATSKVDPELVDVCNIYWADTATTYRWVVDSDGVCDKHAQTIRELNEILKDGDFDRIVEKPKEKVK